MDDPHIQKACGEPHRVTMRFLGDANFQRVKIKNQIDSIIPKLSLASASGSYKFQFG